MKVELNTQRSQIVRADETKSGFIYKAGGFYYISFCNCSAAGDAIREYRDGRYAEDIHFLNIGNSCHQFSHYLNSALLSRDTPMELIGELKVGLI